MKVKLIISDWLLISALNVTLTSVIRTSIRSYNGTTLKCNVIVL